MCACYIPMNIYSYYILVIWTAHTDKILFTHTHKKINFISTSYASADMHQIIIRNHFSNSIHSAIKECQEGILIVSLHLLIKNFCGRIECCFKLGK